MAHLNLADDDATRPTLEGVRRKLGIVPNLFRVVANSPAALNGLLGLSGALAGGVLPAALREQIALLIAETDACGYCLSAHAAIGAGAGLSEADIEAAREGRAATPKDTQALSFARAVLARQGRAAEAELAAVRAAGWDDAAIVEIIANVALNVFTNTVNSVADTPIDFPVRQLRRAA